MKYEVGFLVDKVVSEDDDGDREYESYLLHLRPRISNEDTSLDIGLPDGTTLHLTWDEWREFSAEANNMLDGE